MGLRAHAHGRRGQAGSACSAPRQGLALPDTLRPRGAPPCPPALLCLQQGTCSCLGGRAGRHSWTVASGRGHDGITMTDPLEESRLPPSDETTQASGSRERGPVQQGHGVAEKKAAGWKWPTDTLGLCNSPRAHEDGAVGSGARWERGG